MRNGIILMSIIVLVIGAWFVSQQSNTHTGPLEPFVVRLGWVHQAQFAGFYMAKEKGFYEEAGLDVALLEADIEIGQMQELSEKKVDASVMEAHQLLGEEEHIGTGVAVAAIYQINPHVLAARTDSGIEGPEDFDDVVIGLSGGASEGNTLFQIFVDSVGKGDSVTYTELGFDSVDDFEQNRADIIDVYRIDQPFLAAQRGIPLNIIPLDAYGFETYGDVLVVSSDLVETRPDMVEAFTKATIRGLVYALEYPEEAIDVSLGYAEGDYAERDYQEHIMYESIPLIRGRVSTIGEMDLVLWSTLYESMLRVGVIETPFEITDMYTNEFIR